MASMTKRSFILIVCWLMIAQYRAETNPNIIQRFLNVFIGNYNNYGQRLPDGTLAEFVQVRIDLIPYSAIGSPLIYIEESVEGNPELMLFNLITSITGGVVLQPFDVENPLDFRAYQYNTSEIYDLSKEDFDIYEGCTSTYIEEAPGNFTGSWINCKDEGDDVKFYVSSTCDSFVFSTSSETETVSPNPPYILNRLDKNHVQPGDCPNKS